MNCDDTPLDTDDDGPDDDVSSYYNQTETEGANDDADEGDDDHLYDSAAHNGNCDDTNDYDGQVTCEDDHDVTVDRFDDSDRGSNDAGDVDGNLNVFA